jgi:hypothetical protein
MLEMAVMPVPKTAEGEVTVVGEEVGPTILVHRGEKGETLSSMTLLELEVMGYSQHWLRKPW